MFTAEELEWLRSEEARRLVADNARRDAARVALDGRIPHARLVATQVKYLARAARKLPSYAAAQCILPPRAFEQASSEACAALKEPAGRRLLDLTCGLGVDAWALARRFERVVTLERDPLLAEVARTNFRRLGVGNIEVVCASAEEYLAGCTERFDWIYADPDRRAADGRKQLRWEACSPDVAALWPRMKELAGRICIKNSPLFDVAEALRQAPDGRVEVLSVEGECKEVVLYDDGCGPTVAATMAAGGAVRRFAAAPDAVRPPVPERFDAGRYGWLVIPDVALQKARLARLHLAGAADLWSENGYGFAAEPPAEGVLGRVEAIERIERYDPRALRRALRGRGVELLKHDFPLAAEAVYVRLGAHPGGEVRLALTKIGRDYWAIRLK